VWSSSSEPEPELESESEESSSDSSLLSITWTRFLGFFPAQRNLLVTFLPFAKKLGGCQDPSFEYSSGKPSFSIDLKSLDSFPYFPVPIFLTG
jgi:hypothetical protein